MSTKKIPCSIDNKNVLEDWIYDDVFKWGWMETPKNKRGKREIVGFYDDYLLTATWLLGSNRICFSFIDMPEKHVTGAVRNKLTDYLRLGNEDEEELLFADVWNSGSYIICDFYWKEK